LFLMTANVVIHSDATVLGQAVAARLITRLIDAQAVRGVASVVLTGGRIATAMYSAIRDSPARDAIDWSRVEVWWSDERFLPTGHPERNETQARAALLDSVRLKRAQVHPMPASDGPGGDDPEAAAARYAEELAAVGHPTHQDLPHFDVLLLGVGEDGHVASVFPESPAGYDKRSVIAVRGAPKPPPIRITMTLQAVNSAEDVWLIAAGSDKAGAVGMALQGAGPIQVPAAGVAGTERTLWLLDRAAASTLKPGYRSLRA
jgi:6-phosphogluconolactonase